MVHFQSVRRSPGRNEIRLARISKARGCARIQGIRFHYQLSSHELRPPCCIMPEEKWLRIEIQTPQQFWSEGLHRMCRSGSHRSAKTMPFKFFGYTCSCTYSLATWFPACTPGQRVTMVFRCVEDSTLLTDSHAHRVGHCEALSKILRRKAVSLGIRIRDGGFCQLGAPRLCGGNARSRGSRGTSRDVHVVLG